MRQVCVRIWKFKMYEYIWRFAILTTIYLSDCAKNYLSWTWIIFPPPNIYGATLFNILEYICHGRLISIQTRSGEKVSLAPLTLSYVLQGSKKNIEKMAPRKLYVLLHHVSTPFLLTFLKKLKFVEWFSWCNKLCCLWEKSKFFSFI